MTRLLTDGYQIVNKNFMAYESAWCGRYPVTVEIDRFKSDIGRQFCGCSSIGRARHCHCRGSRIEAGQPRQIWVA